MTGRKTRVNQAFSSQETEGEQLELIRQIQHKFYNISRIMDCVVCDKCRLNGKV